MIQSRNLALFDFDGTITTKDTLLAFARFAAGDRKFLAGLAWLGMPLILQRSGILPAQKAKEIFITHFFRGVPKKQFEQMCRDFTAQVLPMITRPAALDQLKKHRERGDRVLIVSASPHNWITPWADPLGIEVLASQLEFTNDRLTGKLIGKNCNGIEKVERIKRHLNIGDYPTVIAYGDTSGDLPMLELANEKHFKPFRKKLTAENSEQVTVNR